MLRRLVLLAAATLLVACSSAPPAPTPSPTTFPAPPGDGSLTAGELRLRLMDGLGTLWFCDPDSYPVGREEIEGMRQSWPTLLLDADLLGAILERLELPPITQANLNDQQRLAVYRLWKMASAVPLEDIGDGRYRFDYLAAPVGAALQGLRTAGLIDSTGKVTIELQAAASEPICPICLAVGTAIDTPTGPVAVERLRLGDPVWSVDGDGRRIRARVIAVGSTPVVRHVVVRLTLADGRSVTASPGHPLADGRELGTIGIGDAVDGSTVVAVDRVAYEGAATYDVLASGPTGDYLAGGIRLSSTLR